MACGDFVLGRRREQPSCKKVFTGARPGRRQQLEKRAFAEQIEIFRIEVAGIAEAFARFARSPTPPVFQACQAALVELDGALERSSRSTTRACTTTNTPKTATGSSSHQTEIQTSPKTKKATATAANPAARRALPMRRNCFSRLWDARRRLFHARLVLFQRTHNARLTAVAEHGSMTRPIRIPVTDVFDLHTVPPREVKPVVENYLEEAHRMGFRALRIIHGRGIGVQREMVRSILSKTPFVASFSDAPARSRRLGRDSRDAAATLREPEMGTNIWNLSARRGESLSKADADRRNQLMLESPSRSDGDLLRLLSGGDEKAFLEFYRKHQGVVYRFALQMSGKTEIAEEVTQDVFMVVMKSASDMTASAARWRRFCMASPGISCCGALERETALYNASWTIRLATMRTAGERPSGTGHLRRPGAERAHRNAAEGGAGACRRPIAKWWCCAICMNGIMPRRPARWDAPSERCDRACIGRGRCWPRRCGRARGVRYE